jgi:hypothetical protein
MTDTEISSSITWRNEELAATDWVVQISDHPERPLYYTYRQKLRDWPSLDTFPSASSRPTL